MNRKLNFEIIKQIRKEKAMSRTQLCKMSKIPMTTLHDLEEGVTTNPRILTLIAITDAFQLDISEFVALLLEYNSDF